MATTIERSSPIVGEDKTLTQSLGIETLGGIFTPILAQGSSVPTSDIQTFSTASDDQQRITLKVFRGTAQTFEDAHSLGSWDVTGIAPLPRGTPEVAVTFRVAVDGLITLSAVDSKTGLKLEIRPSGT